MRTRRHSPLFSHTKRGYEYESESHLYAAHNSWSEANVTNAAYNNDASQRSQHPDVHTHTNETPLTFTHAPTRHPDVHTHARDASRYAEWVRNIWNLTSSDPERPWQPEAEILYVNN
jgi:hypothetical protein